MKKIEKNERTLNAKLFVRILPTIDFSYESVKIEKNKKVLHVKCLQEFGMTQTEFPKYWCFCTDGIFWNSSQEEVFETITDGLFDNLFEGVKAIIISFGQTGTGKTFTTSGLRFQFQNRGLALRVLSQLFEEIERRSDIAKITLGMSYVEFIGESIKDLISNKQVKNIQCITEYPISDEAYAWKEIFVAECRKSYTDSAPYRGSNRGHSILTFYTHAESLVDTDPTITHSKVHLVDMSGIDNVGNKPSAWRNKLDLGYSNLSKTLMEQLIHCLSTRSWKSEKYICPYKSNRLLMYLKDTLQPKALIRFIAHIYGNEENLPITISTLKFGQNILLLKPSKLERFYQPNCELHLLNLKKECLRLKNEAEMAGMLNDVPDMSHISQERLLEIKRLAEGFLLGQVKSLTLFSLGQANLTLDVFRDLFKKVTAEREQAIKDAVMAATELLQQSSERQIHQSSHTTLQQKLSKRKGRMHDSLTTSLSYRSSDSLAGHGVTRGSSTVIGVGNIDKKGISIGPGKMSSFEGNATKAFKKSMRNRRPDSITVKSNVTVPSKDAAVSSAKLSLEEETQEGPIQSLPTKETAWQNFFNEKSELVNTLKKTIANREEEVTNYKKKYMESLLELFNLRKDIEFCQAELEKCQHIRHVYGKVQFDEDGTPIPGDLEKEFMDSLDKKKRHINVAVESCHVALINFRNSIEQLIEAKNHLEHVFHDYCREKFKTIYPEDLPECQELDDSSDKVTKESSIDVDTKTQARMELYSHLQRKLIKYVPKKKKKEWQSLF